MSWFTSYIKTLFDGIWGLFSLHWPGFSFTYGHVFLAGLLASGALGIFMSMLGVSITGAFTTRGGNNGKIKISTSRRSDTK